VIVQQEERPKSDSKVIHGYAESPIVLDQSPLLQRPKRDDGAVIKEVVAARMLLDAMRSPNGIVVGRASPDRSSAFGLFLTATLVVAATFLGLSYIEMPTMASTTALFDAAKAAIEGQISGYPVHRVEALTARPAVAPIRAPAVVTPTARGR
jgi:hypothetical protein